MTRENKPHSGSQNRRQFLKATGALGVAGIAGLAGCTGGSDGGSGGDQTTASGGGSDTTDSTTSSGGSEVREKYGLQELDYELEDELNVFQWGDYWPDGTISDFETP